MRSMCDGERGLRGRGEAPELLLARPESPSRCTFPITALRVMLPSSAAIWLAERPSDHSFFRSSTRSSVHDMPTLLEPVGQAVARIPPRGRAASRHPTHTQPQTLQKTVRRTKWRTRQSKSYNMAGVWRKTRAVCVHTFLCACG